MDTIEIPPRPAWLKRKPTRTTDAAERAAAKFGVDPAHVLALMPEALAIVRRDVEYREQAKARARYLTGLDARLCACIENHYRDYSSVTNFDTAARDVASEYPELGFDPDGHDTPARVWELIREGKQPIPCRHSDCVAEWAAGWCEVIETGEYPDDGDASFDPAEWESEPQPVYAAESTNPACDVQPQEPPRENSANRLCVRTSRPDPLRRDARRRARTRPHHQRGPLSELRPVNVRRAMVRPDRTGPPVRYVAPVCVARGQTRLGRVTCSEPAYVAGRASCASWRGRDGPTHRLFQFVSAI